MVKLTVTQPETAIEARTSASQCQFEPASVVVSDCEGAMDDLEEFELNQIAADDAAEKAEAEDDVTPFPWNHVKTPAQRETARERAERRRLETEADAMAAASPLVAALLGLKS